MENEEKNPYRSGYTKGLGFGLILMLIGVVFLGFNFGLIPMALKWVIISWPMLLIVIGVAHYLRRKIFSGTILVLIGSFFILPRIIDAYPALFPGFNGDFTHIYWPSEPPFFLGPAGKSRLRTRSRRKCNMSAPLRSRTSPSLCPKPTKRR